MATAKPKPTTRAKVTWYKVLSDDAQSQNGGSWDWAEGAGLPAGGKPGAWQKVADGVAIDWCRAGFHLTCVPERWVNRSTDRVFVAEFRGEVAWPDRGSPMAQRDKIACREVRLVRELVGREREAVLAAPAPKRFRVAPKAKTLVPAPGTSVPCRVMEAAWKTRAARSWRRVNAWLWETAVLAVKHGQRFEPDDVEWIDRSFRGRFWLQVTALHALAIEHGNASAAVSCERALGWEPLFAPDTGRRLTLGAAFAWRGKTVTVTSRGDDWVGVVTYKRQTAAVGAWRRKVATRARITRAELLATKKTKGTGA